ncbi:Mannose-P-dolichol utilization defect 1 protein [Actinidia chinensis var. chinensis]|uniref:Mannose-P-dolichol utilization defect 1 protein n=1 Tax=Actinidia chinensis var. chinensis TaxID=1590841 RepID=A0A2R6R3B4_ACTCC|nr:Mannose-P-dolichol utilization defect 1 protein [Actinidia chinensis var. chinensis]
MVDMKFLGMDFSCAFGSLSDGKFPEKDCLLPLISKLLGYCIVAASTTVKVPQILKILKHQSVRGLSVVAFELEVVGYTIALAYCLHKGLPFSAYGELAFLLIQAIILVAIIYYYSQPVGTKTWIRALLYCAVAPTILAGQIDPILFEALYASQHAIFFFARVPQIWANYSIIPMHMEILEIGQNLQELNFPSGYILMAVLWAEQKYRGTQLLNLFNEFCRFNGESFHQPTGKSSDKRCYGLCAWYRDEWDDPESDNHIPEAAWEERKEK